MEDENKIRALSKECLVGVEQGSSTRGPRAACGPPASFVRPGKGISESTMRYEY